MAPKASTKERHVPLNARIPVIHASQAAKPVIFRLRK